MAAYLSWWWGFTGMKKWTPPHYIGKHQSLTPLMILCYACYGCPLRDLIQQLTEADLESPQPNSGWSLGTLTEE